MSSCGVELYRSSQNRWYRILYTVYQGYLPGVPVSLTAIDCLERTNHQARLVTLHDSEALQCTSGLLRAPGRPIEAFSLLLYPKTF